MNNTFDKWDCYETVVAHPQFVDVPTNSPMFQRNFRTQMKLPINLNSENSINNLKKIVIIISTILSFNLIWNKK